MSLKAATEKPWSDCVVNLVGLVVFHGDFNYTVIWAKSKDGKNSGWVEVSGMWMERSDLGGADLMGRNIAALPGRGWGCSWHEHDREQCQEAGRAGGEGWQPLSRKSDTARIMKRGWETLHWCWLRGRRPKAGLKDVRKDTTRTELQSWMPALSIHPPWQALHNIDKAESWIMLRFFCPVWQQCLSLTARGVSSS